MKSVTNIVFMTGLEIRCNVPARSFNDIREWNWNVCIQENAWKNTENEEKAGRIKANRATITSRKLVTGICTGATFRVILASLLEDRSNVI